MRRDHLTLGNALLHYRRPGGEPMGQQSLTWPEPLTEKYRPRTIGAFVGLAKPRKVLSAYVRKPYPAAWLFVGPPGTGKTTMGLALAEELGAELQHIPSQRCNLESIDNAIRRCWYVARGGGFHLVLC